MMQHECFLAYAPRGAGLLCAVTYVSTEPDIVGWFVGAKRPLLSVDGFLGRE